MVISEKKLNLTLRQVLHLILLQYHVAYNIFYLDYHQDLQPTISNIYQLVWLPLHKHGANFKYSIYQIKLSEAKPKREC